MSRFRYELDMDKAIGAIRAYNASLCAQAGEHLLDVAFSDFHMAMAPAGVHERIVLLDGLWGTRLFMERGAPDRIANSLAKKSEEIIGLLESLANNDLVERPDRVTEIAQQALAVILNQVGEDGEKYRQNYSFASKFFHWCTRHHFPIVDGKARKTINRWQRDLGVGVRVRSDTAAMGGLTYLREYERWITFYSDLLYGLAENGAERLRRVDYDSQTATYRVQNSVLRILDKYFYVQGGGSIQGRAPER